MEVLLNFIYKLSFVGEFIFFKKYSAISSLLYLYTFKASKILD